MHRMACALVLSNVQLRIHAVIMKHDRSDEKPDAHTGKSGTELFHIVCSPAAGYPLFTKLPRKTSILQPREGGGGCGQLRSWNCCRGGFLLKTPERVHLFPGGELEQA